MTTELNTNKAPPKNKKTCNYLEYVNVHAYSFIVGGIINIRKYVVWHHGNCMTNYDASFVVYQCN